MTIVAYSAFIQIKISIVCWITDVAFAAKQEIAQRKAIVTDATRLKKSKTYNWKKLVLQNILECKSRANKLGIILL